MVSGGVALAALMAADAKGDGVCVSTRGVPCGVACREDRGDCGAQERVSGVCQ